MHMPTHYFSPTPQRQACRRVESRRYLLHCRKRSALLPCERDRHQNATQQVTRSRVGPCMKTGQAADDSFHPEQSPRTVIKEGNDQPDSYHHTSPNKAFVRQGHSLRTHHT